MKREDELRKWKGPGRWGSVSPVSSHPHFWGSLKEQTPTQRFLDLLLCGFPAREPSATKSKKASRAGVQ